MDRYAQFRADMEAAGLELEDYKGRYFYDGPAVRTDESRNEGPDLQEVIRMTTVPVQWDNLGYDYIVYPR